MDENSVASANAPESVSWCQEIRRGGDGLAAADSIALGYDERFLRRKRLTSTKGRSFMVDLAEVTSLDPGDAFVLDDGTLITVEAAREAVLEIRGGSLSRLAWHIGNRHCPCEVQPDRLVIRQDHVLEAMLLGLGAFVTRSMQPFRPEGGAYGLGRTFGHDHGHGPGGHAGGGQGASDSLFVQTHPSAFQGPGGAKRGR